MKVATFSREFFAFFETFSGEFYIFLDILVLIVFIHLIILEYHMLHI